MADERLQIEEQLLVMDAQDGDRAAMDELVRRWQKRLWRHAYRLTGDSQGAWDVTQQAWVGIIRGLRRLDDPARFRPWVYRIVTNKACDWIAARKRRRQLEAQAVDEHTNGRTAEVALADMLGRLDIRKRVVLGLYYFEKLSVGEIAVALKIPRGTVKSRLSSARSEFKMLWEGGREG